MTVTRAFAIIIVSATVCGILGGLLGYTLAVALPDYYQTVFRPRFPRVQEPPINAIHVGLGLGISQGMIGGLVVGGVVVLAVAIYQSRRKEVESRG